MYRELPIAMTPSGPQKMLLLGEALSQPFLDQNVFRQILSSGDKNSRVEAIHLCSRDENGQWISAGLSPEVIDESCHPHLHNYDAEYILLAREVLSHFPGAVLRIDLSTEMDSDRHVVSNYNAQTLFYFPQGNDITCPSSIICDAELDFIPGVRTLERCASRFWDTLGTKAWEDGGVQGDHQLYISANFFHISYQNGDGGCLDPNAEGDCLTLESHFIADQWIHQTKFTFRPSQKLTMMTEDQISLPNTERLIQALGHSDFEIHELLNFQKTPLAVTSIEEDDESQTVFVLQT